MGRVSVVAVLVGLAVAVFAQAALGAFGIAKWEAGTCNGTEAEVTSCKYSSPNSAFYTQAAGHPPWGLTGFELAHSGEGGSRAPEGEPLKRIRVDVEPGLAANPQALHACRRTDFEAKLCNPDTQVGFVELEAVATLPVLGNQLLTLKGKVFNLEEEPGLPLLFGIEVEGVEPLAESVQLFLEGHVSYAKEPQLEARGLPSGDFHEWFQIDNVPHEVAVEVKGVLPLTKAPLKTLTSKLFFNGRAGGGNFLTLPSVCGPPALSTSYLEIESDTKEIVSAPTVPPVGVEGCDKVPFKPSSALTPETAQSDTPDGAVAEVKVPQFAGAEEINTADIKDAHVTLPEGLTLNPAAAPGLETCTQEQIAIGKTMPVSCPAASRIGSVTIETDLPAGSLAGPVYLGSPSGAVITGPPYTIYIDAESIYGVSVRLQGQVNANPATGRLEATFLHNPELPFSDLIMKLNGGPRAPLANPLACGPAPLESLFTPYTGFPPAYSPPPFAFVTSGCPSPLPFALSQSAHTSTSAAAAFTSDTLNLGRADGQQYLSQLRTVLPEGMIGAIPSVTLCGEPSAAEGTCPAASHIGTATVTVGAGSQPIQFSGPVFMTGPYGGAPFGLSVPVPAKVGRFDLGSGACDCVVTRASVGVDPYSARVVATSSLPTIVKGVPLRLRSLAVSVDRPNFLFNPTNCGALATDTTLTSTFGATQSLSSPFQASGCSALGFAPKFSARTRKKTSRANGAELIVRVRVPSSSRANIKSVFAQLPKQLPSRLSTLNLACRQAVFAASPFACPAAAQVGTVVVRTPVLPVPLRGPAVLVSHGGAAFPDLDFVLSGDGVTVILVGNTNIARGITSSNFASLPDVPVSSVEVRLPMGRKSALGANGNLCKRPLYMPTVITGQNGKVLRLRTRMLVAGCPHKKHRHHRHRRHRRRHGRRH